MLPSDLTLSALRFILSAKSGDVYKRQGQRHRREAIDKEDSWCGRPCARQYRLRGEAF